MKAEKQLDVEELRIDGADYRHYLIDGAVVRTSVTPSYWSPRTEKGEATALETPRQMVVVDKLTETGWFELVRFEEKEDSSPNAGIQAAITLLFGLVEVEQTGA